MKKNVALCSLLFALCAFGANAAIPYRAEQVKTSASESDRRDGKKDSEAFARDHRFYAGVGFNQSWWSGGADDFTTIVGKSNSSFEASVGVRLYDTFRLEANYYNLQADWDVFSMSGNTFFVNALFDARIDSLYRGFRKQTLVPYVGLGAGASSNSVTGATIENKISPTVAALVGLGIEMGDRFALDLGYRYMVMFSPDFDVIDKFAPTAHQFRAGLRVNF